MRKRLVSLGAAVGLLSVLCSSCSSDVQPIYPALKPVSNGINTAEGRAALPKQEDSANCGDPTLTVRPPDRLPPAGKMPGNSTMAKIVQRGMLIAGVDQNTYLFGSRNPLTGTLEGFDIDRVYDLSRALFGDAGKVRFKVVSSADRVKALQDGAVDVVVRTMTINCARRADIAFSSVYYQAKQRLLVPRSSGDKSLADLRGKKICAAKGSTSLTTVVQREPKVVPVATQEWSDCLVLLQQGLVAAISTDDSILAGMKAQDPTLDVVGPVLSQEPYGIGIPKNNTDMVGFVNGVLDQIRDNGQWAASYNKWLGPRLGKAPSPPAPNYGPDKGGS